MSAASQDDIAAPPRVGAAPRSPAALFQPFRLGRLELKNRIVMAPMTRCFSPRGVPGGSARSGATPCSPR